MKYLKLFEQFGGNDSFNTFDPFGEEKEFYDESIVFDGFIIKKECLPNGEIDYYMDKGGNKLLGYKCIKFARKSKEGILGFIIDAFFENQKEFYKEYMIIRKRNLQNVTEEEIQEIKNLFILSGNYHNVRIGFATIENPQERILNFINDLINI